MCGIYLQRPRRSLQSTGPDAPEHSIRTSYQICGSRPHVTCPALSLPSGTTAINIMPTGPLPTDETDISSYDPVKWAKSAAASKRIIDSGIYSLYTVPMMKTRMHPQASQAEFPLGVGGPILTIRRHVQWRSTGCENPELIYATPLNNNIISIAFPLKLGGWNGLGINCS